MQRVRNSGSVLSAYFWQIALTDSASIRACAGSYTPQGRSQWAYAVAFGSRRRARSLIDLLLSMSDHGCRCPTLPGRAPGSPGGMDALADLAGGGRRAVDGARAAARGLAAGLAQPAARPAAENPPGPARDRPASRPAGPAAGQAGGPARARRLVA